MSRARQGRINLWELSFGLDSLDSSIYIIIHGGWMRDANTTANRQANLRWRPILNVYDSVECPARCMGVRIKTCAAVKSSLNIRWATNGRFINVSLACMINTCLTMLGGRRGNSCTDVLFWARPYASTMLSRQLALIDAWCHAQCFGVSEITTWSMGFNL